MAAESIESQSWHRQKCYWVNINGSTRDELAVQNFSSRSFMERQTDENRSSINPTLLHDCTTLLSRACWPSNLRPRLTLRLGPSRRRSCVRGPPVTRPRHTLNLLSSQHSPTVVWKCTIRPQKQNVCTVPRGVILGSCMMGPHRHRPQANGPGMRMQGSAVKKKPSLSPVGVSQPIYFDTPEWHQAQNDFCT